MHAHKEEELARGFSFGDPDAEEYQNLFTYDEEFENKMAEKALEMRVVPLESAGKLSSLTFGIEDEDEIPQKSYAYDIDFEIEMAARVIRNGRGYFYRRDWMFVDGSEVCLNEGRPLLLYTQAHHAKPGTACFKAHNQHPFVALVHLLKHADVASTVFISMPYFTDMHVLDELCHFAQDEEKEEGAW